MHSSRYINFALFIRRGYARYPSKTQTMEELMGAMSGGRGGRGGKGRKKGGKKGLKQDNMEVTFGHGKDVISWPQRSSVRIKYAAGWLKEISRRGATQSDGDSPIPDETKFYLRQVEGQKRVARPISQTGWSQKGWTGKSMNGRYVGCPEAPDGEPLTDFHSVIVELKRVSNQTAAGKKRILSAAVVVGNGNGLVGFGVGKGEESVAAIRKAKNKAVNYLQFIPRYNDHTLYHNIYVKYKQTKIQMEKRCPGTGLSCHRIITSIFQLAGIKDAKAKIISNSTNPLNVVRATFKGITSQQMYQTVSDETNCFLVEKRRECHYRPVVMALPKSEDTEEMRDFLRKKQLM